MNVFQREDYTAQKIMSTGSVPGGFVLRKDRICVELLRLGEEREIAWINGACSFQIERDFDATAVAWIESVLFGFKALNDPHIDKEELNRALDKLAHVKRDWMIHSLEDQQ